MKRNLPSPDAVAFRVERLGDTYTPVVIYANGGEFRHAPCVCLDQAASLATREGARRLRFDGLHHKGAVIAPDLTCPLGQSSWTWPHHGHTHGTLTRLGYPA